MQADIVIDAGWILPIAPDETVAFEASSIVITNGKIVEILPTKECHTKYSPSQTIDRAKGIVMPGLVNAHTHTGLSLMRGRADDQPLLKWLHETVWPLEAAFASNEEFCEDAAVLATAEMIRGGTTCFADMYFYPGAAARAAVRSGMRAVIGLVLVAFPSAYASSIDEYIERGEAVMDDFADQPSIHFAYAPHAPYTVPPDTWIQLKKLSKEKGVPIHTHLHETKEECTASLILDRNHPACHQSDEMCHPLEDFRRKGLLDSNFVGAHMVHLTDEEIAICAEKGVHIAHCPTSNAKLASGFCPVHKLVKAGVNVAIGTDSAASNNSLDLLSEVKMTALTAKNVACDATVVPAATALRMGTINGARAFGIDNVTGSLEVGKSADLICIEVGTHAANSPIFDPHSAVVYAASRDDVTDVMVGGNFLLRDKKYCNLDLQEILKRTEYWRSRIVNHPPSSDKN